MTITESLKRSSALTVTAGSGKALFSAQLHRLFRLFFLKPVKIRTARSFLYTQTMWNGPWAATSWFGDENTNQGATQRKLLTSAPQRYSEGLAWPVLRGYQNRFIQRTLCHKADINVRKEWETAALVTMLNKNNSGLSKFVQKKKKRNRLHHHVTTFPYIFFFFFTKKKQ